MTNDLAGTVGLVISPLNLFEFRGGVILNPNNILDLRNGVPKLIDLKYEAFVAASFLIKNTIRVTAEQGLMTLEKGQDFLLCLDFH